MRVQICLSAFPKKKCPEEANEHACLDCEVTQDCILGPSLWKQAT